MKYNINNYCVYIHIFPNNKYYVGLTKQDPNKRWGINGIGYKKQPVYNAIKEFGWDNIDHIIVYENLDVNNAIEKEKELIKKYDSINNGYNISSGGDLGSISYCEFEYNGIIYSSDDIASMSIYDLSGHDITTRINHHGWSIEKAINTPKKDKNIIFDYNGDKITTRQAYDIRINKELSYEQIKNRLLKHNWSVERAITQSNKKKKQPFNTGEKKYKYNDKLYSSYELCEISSVGGLTPCDITTRINHHGWSVEKAISTPKKNRNKKYLYNGNEYTSKELAELSPYDISRSDITTRINRCGWSIHDAINTPKK